MAGDEAAVGTMIAAIVVSYRSGGVLRGCLQSLAAQPEVTEIIVVNNGNAPAENRLLETLPSTEPRLRVVQAGRNLGFAAACNLAARHSSAPVLAFVNPDLVTPPGTMALMLRTLSAHPDAWMLGGALRDMAGNEQRGGRRDVLTPWRAVVEALRLDRLFPAHPYFRRLNMIDQPLPEGVAAVPTVSGAFFVMPRHRFQHLGGLDESMFLHVEDIDLCLRVTNEGGQVLYCGHIPVYHHSGTSDACRAFVEWHKTVSTVRYFFKHFLRAYPSWALWLVAGLLWLRFAVLALSALPQDASRLLRRARGIGP